MPKLRGWNRIGCAEVQQVPTRWNLNLNACVLPRSHPFGRSRMQVKSGTKLEDRTRNSEMAFLVRGRSGETGTPSRRPDFGLDSGTGENTDERERSADS